MLKPEEIKYFEALEYEDETGAKRFDIRHSKKTVIVFSKHTIEETLSKKPQNTLKIIKFKLKCYL
jgi:hypothetical protein